MYWYDRSGRPDRYAPGAYPELLDEIEKAQEAMTVFENRPDLLEDAERFREALSDS